MFARHYFSAERYFFALQPNAENNRRCGALRALDFYQSMFFMKPVDAYSPLTHPTKTVPHEHAASGHRFLLFSTLTSLLSPPDHPPDHQPNRRQPKHSYDDCSPAADGFVLPLAGFGAAFGHDFFGDQAQR
jgi:hypothetical protein